VQTGASDSQRVNQPNGNRYRSRNGVPLTAHDSPICQPFRPGQGPGRVVDVNVPRPPSINIRPVPEAAIDATDFAKDIVSAATKLLPNPTAATAVQGCAPVKFVLTPVAESASAESNSESAKLVFEVPEMPIAAMPLEPPSLQNTIRDATPGSYQNGVPSIGAAWQRQQIYAPSDGTSIMYDPNTTIVVPRRFDP